MIRRDVKKGAVTSPAPERTGFSRAGGGFNNFGQHSLAGGRVGVMVAHSLQRSKTQHYPAASSKQVLTLHTVQDC